MVENRKSTGHGVEAFHLPKLSFEPRDVEAGQMVLRGVSSLKGWESEKIANGMMRRTGLWIFEEGLKVLEANKASEKVQAICFERDGTDEIVDQGC
ncbi:uncharacterized protein LOC115749655 isoform X6 [Rhodamnia argentea]|uniref:Uncharacterized protein LOC115749655 isoform X6 n=1 Tax=Rhodamnia argentea TaxID=178133 RepID=A0A8B8Q7Z5_9MYRT|nr:uncharacterized protein LOC115749655 isoform X6 [Rhodamnia argentea]